MPAVSALANTVDNDGLTRMYKQSWWTTGTPGTVPGSTGTLPFAANLPYMQATTKLTNYAVPVDGRVAVLTPEMQQYLSAAQFLNFNPGGQISDFFRNGMFGRKALGIDEWFMDQNCATHTIGLLGGTPRINGANQTGTSINTDGWTASIQVLNEGDVVQFAGTKTVNPQNRQSTGQLNDFVSDYGTARLGVARENRGVKLAAHAEDRSIKRTDSELNRAAHCPSPLIGAPWWSRPANWRGNTTLTLRRRPPFQIYPPATVKSWNC